MSRGEIEAEAPLAAAPGVGRVPEAEAAKAEALIQPVSIEEGDIRVGHEGPAAKLPGALDRPADEGLAETSAARAGNDVQAVKLEDAAGVPLEGDAADNGAAVIDGNRHAAALGWIPPLRFAQVGVVIEGGERKAVLFENGRHHPPRPVGMAGRIVVLDTRARVPHSSSSGGMPMML